MEAYLRLPLKHYGSKCDLFLMNHKKPVMTEVMDVTLLLLIITFATLSLADDVSVGM